MWIRSFIYIFKKFYWIFIAGWEIPWRSEGINENVYQIGKSKIINNKDIHKKENIFENNISNNYKSFTLNYNLLPDPLINKGLHTKTNGENYFSEELKVHNKGLALNNNTDFNLALTSKDLSKLKPPIEELKEQNE